MGFFKSFSRLRRTVNYCGLILRTFEHSLTSLIIATCRGGGYGTPEAEVGVRSWRKPRRCVSVGGNVRGLGEAQVTTEWGVLFAPNWILLGRAIKLSARNFDWVNNTFCSFATAASGPCWAERLGWCIRNLKYCSPNHNIWLLAWSQCVILLMLLSKSSVADML